MVLPRSIQADQRPAPTERMLVEACLAGDRRAFAPIVHAHESGMYGLLLTLTGDLEEARDLTQEALVKAWRRLVTFDRSRTLRPWLLAIARSCWKDERRRARHRYPHDPIPCEGAPDLADHLEGPEDIAIGKERRERLWAAFERLGSNEREVLVLKDIQELTYDEVATVLRIPRGTVASRVFHARRRLRDLLVPALPEAMAGVR